jgi:hypothetical protein
MNTLYFEILKHRKDFAAKKFLNFQDTLSKKSN